MILVRIRNTVVKNYDKIIIVDTTEEIVEYKKGDMLNIKDTDNNFVIVSEDCKYHSGLERLSSKNKKILVLKQCKPRLIDL